MILYIRCSCTAAQRITIQSYKSNGYEIRVTSKNPVWRKEAKEHGLKLPFTLVDGVYSEL